MLNSAVNEDKKMKKLKIEDNVDLFVEVKKTYEQTHNVILIGYYSEIIEVANALIKETNAEISNANIYSPDYDEYDDAYYLEVIDDEIWIDEAQSDGVMSYFGDSEGEVFVGVDFIDEYLKINPDKNLTAYSCDDFVLLTEDESKGEPCLCMDDDGMGFTFCIHDKDSEYKFKYKSDKKLTPDDAWVIVSRHF